MRMPSKRHLVSTLAAIFAAPVSAALIVVDPSYFAGDAVKQDLVVFDDENNLFWHKLTPSIGKSYDSVVLEFGEDGLFEGMRVASLDEVTSLFTQAGLPTATMHFTFTDPAQVAAATTFRELFGFHSFRMANSLLTTAGMTSTTQVNGLHHVAGFVSGPMHQISLGISSVSPDVERPTVGTCLVYEGTYTPPSNGNGNGGVGVVPEPGTLALLATGLVLGAGISRRVKK